MISRFSMRAAVIAAAVSAAVVSGTSASAQSADAAIDKAVATWTTVRSATGTIEQTVMNSLMGTSATRHAQIQLGRPNQLSIRFTDAKGDAIVSDGKWLWIYLPESMPGQVIRRAATQKSGIPADPGQFLDSPRTRYDFADKGTATIDGRNLRVVGLTPKKGIDPGFTKATVWIDETEGLIRQFEVVEDANRTRRVRFTTLTTNARVDADAFKFIVPKGVKVVDQK
jgi:outer membrane lipoprotein carrier protein